MLAASPDQGPRNPEESEASEDEVSPLFYNQHLFRITAREVLYLVARGDQGANKTGDNHDLINQDGVEDRGPWQTSSKEDVHEQQRRGDDPCSALA